MGKITKFYILVFIFWLSNLTISYAGFEDIGCGARPAGMGNAFCAVGDDANAFLYNPSGLIQLKKIQVSAMYANLYPLLTDKSTIANNFLAIAYPMRSTTVGIAWFNLSVISDPERANASYQENTCIFTYAREISLFSIGLSARFHTKEYGQNYWTSVNPVFGKKRTASGIGIDIGTLYRSPNRKFKLGLTLVDINQPDMGIDASSPVPILARAGISYEFEPPAAFNDLRGAIDITYRDGDLKVQGGLEGWLMERTIGIRAGGGFGTNYYGNISMGASYQLTEEMYNNDFRLDYAFTYPLSGLQPTGGTHRISLTMGFGINK